MKILILITKDNRQLLKLVQYNKLKKSAKTKISRINKENNILEITGDINEKFDFIQTIYKKKQEFNFSKSELFEMEIKPYINGIFSFFNMDKAEISSDYLETEYNSQITKNKNQVLEYNIKPKEPKGSKIFDEILNYVEKGD